MNFSEAMQRLKEGAKVSRPHWNAPRFFKLVDGEPKCFEGSVTFYPYDESIFLSDGWVVDGIQIDGCDVVMPFSDIIPHLQKGAKARMEHWENSYIYADTQTKSILLNTISQVPFREDFESLMANDWIEIP